MPVANLKAYKGTYTVIPANESTTLVFTGEDFWIVFRTSTLCKIKVKVDGAYQSKMIWHTGEIDAVADVFTLSFSSARSYYDDLDQSTSENPSVLKLQSLLTYGSHTLIIEVVNEVTNVLNLEGVFVFDSSSRKNARDIDTTETGKVDVETDVEELRNDVVVVGAELGLFQQDGVPINPNNPIHIKTYSRAVDLASVYDHSAGHYVGRHIAFEVYNERILNQDRADHIAISALKKYRKPASFPRYSITGDPRLEPHDPIGFTEKKLNTLNDDRVWIESVSEKFGQGEYISEITTMPREPIPSFEQKAEPDLAAFDGEPIININLMSQGKRIAGDDATESGGTVTIGTSPAWTADMWNDYYVFDEAGEAFKITDTTASTLVIDLDGKTYTDGNWSISFDPFDTDQKGAPLEIHYDQVVNAKIQIWIKDTAGDSIALVNPETKDLIQEWGSGKVAYWSGVAQYKTQQYKTGCYVSKFSLLNYAEPFRIVFVIQPETFTTDSVEIDTNSGGSNYHDGSIQMNGSDVTNKVTGAGAVRIYVKLLNDLPLVKVNAAGSQNYADDIKYYGYISNVNEAGDPVILTVTPDPSWSVDQYKDYLFCDAKTGWVFNIISNTGNTISVDANQWDVGGDHTTSDFVMVIGQSAQDWQNLIHDHFKSTDNDLRGLKLQASIFSTPAKQLANFAKGPWDDPTLNSDHRIRYSVAGETDGFYGNEDLPGQHYPDRGIYVELFTDLSGNWTEYKPIPGNNVLSNPDLRILADLDIYYKDPDKVGLQKLLPDTISGDNLTPNPVRNFIDTQGFVDLREWVKYLKTEELLFSDENTTTVLQQGKYSAWYFLFKFAFMDRAGRFVLSRFQAKDKEDYYGEDNRLFYLVGWMPEDAASKTANTQFSFGNDNVDLIRAGLFKKFTSWS